MIKSCVVKKSDRLNEKVSDIITRSNKVERQAIFGIRVHFRDWFVFVNDTHKWNYAVKAIGIRSDI